MLIVPGTSIWKVGERKTGAGKRSNAVRQERKAGAITSSASVAVNCIILKPSPTFSSMVTSRTSLGKTGGLSLTSCSVISTCGGRRNNTVSVREVRDDEEQVKLLGELRLYPKSTHSERIFSRPAKTSESFHICQTQHGSTAGKLWEQERLKRGVWTPGVGNIRDPGLRERSIRPPRQLVQMLKRQRRNWEICPDRWENVPSLPANVWG